MKLWLSETISQFGSQFSGLAIPLTAVLILSATPLQMGLLTFTATLPFLIFGLFIGVWVDRHRRRPILVYSNLGRALILGIIPIVYLFGRLTMLTFFVAGFFLGTLQVFFDVSYQAYLPSLVRRDQLVDANSKLEASRSTAQVAGPSIAGAVIQIVSAPIAIGGDALGFIGSALSIGRIREREDLARISSTANDSFEKNTLQEAPAPSGVRTRLGTVWLDIREGLGVVLQDTRLRMIAGSTGTSNFFSSALFALVPIVLADPVRGLGLAPVVIGLIFSVGSIGALVGVLLAGRTAKRLGVGYAIVGSMLLGGLGSFAYYFATPALNTPLFTIPRTMVAIPQVATLFTIPRMIISYSAAVIMAGTFLISIAVVVYNVNQVSLRQAIVPLKLQGRMNATMRFLVWGTLPVGGLAGGLLGSFFGIRPTLLVTAIGGSLAFLWVLLSPVRTLKKIPEPLA